MKITKNILLSYLEAKHPALHSAWTRSERKPAAADSKTLDLFDVIEEDMKDKVVAAVDKNPDRLHVRIDSPGGDVYSCVTMINALTRVKHLTTENLGIAASCAAVLFMLGHDRITHPASQYLFHRVWTIALGNAPQLRDTADNIEHFDKMFFDTVYSKKMANVEEKSFYKMLERDKFLTAEEVEHYAVANVTKEEKKEGREVVDRTDDDRKKIIKSYLTAAEISVLSSIRSINKKHREKERIGICPQRKNQL